MVDIQGQNLPAAIAPESVAVPAGGGVSGQGRWRRFAAGRSSLIGLVFLLAEVLAAAGAPIVAPYRPDAQSYTAVLKGPTLSHWLGTDQIGRDVLSRLIFGARASLIVGVGAVVIAVLGGVIIGTLAGYLGRWCDEVLMRVMDALQAFPGIILALTITAVAGPSITHVTIAIGVVAIPDFSRVVRGQVLAVRESEYVQAARILGFPLRRILGRHVLPNVAGPIIIQATFLLASSILAEAGLSFLGLGVQPPTASWGQMLQDGYPVLSTAPWLSIAPGAMIFLTVLAVNFVGDGLQRVVGTES